MHARRLLPPAVALAVLFLAASCGGDGETPTDPGTETPTASSLSVSPSSATSDALEDTTAFSAAVRDQDGNTMSGVTVGWSSSDEAVAVVSGGDAVARGNGTAEIVASAEGLADTATLTVDQAASRVTVSPGGDTLTAGDSVQLSAEATDANGNAVPDPIFAWSSSDTAVATVDSTGLVRAKTDGSVDVTAELDGVGGGSVVTVIPPPDGAPALGSVTPSPMPEGGTATLSGSNFSADAGANTVVVDGDTVQVLSATSTSLEIDVPTYDCLPARDVTVEVTTTAGSASGSFPLEPDEAAVSVAAGQMTRVEDPGQFCLQFDASSASERYLLGVQSLSGTGGDRTTVQITAEAADGSGSASISAVSSSVEGTAAAREGEMPGRSPTLEAHRQAEMERRAWEVRHLDPGASLLARSSGPTLDVSKIVSGNVQVGDTVSLRVPDGRTSDLCANYLEVGGVVKAIGSAGIFVADTANPSGGLTDADYEDFSNRMDGNIFSTLVDYFGSPTDLDNNGRVVVLISRAVNVTAPNTLGFVWPGDLFPRSTTDGSFSCAASDEGELYYGKAPDPEGVFGDPYPTDVARSQTPFIMSHELTHVIQQTRRFDANQTFMSSIVAEGQATLGEEVVGHSVTGRTTGQDYGFTTAFNADSTDEIDWYADGFRDLVRYFGFESQTRRVPEAPELCGWWREDPYPCTSRPLWYGVSWTFLRWASDQYGPDYPGGEKGFHQDLIGNGGTGPRNVADVLGQNFQQMMANWAASLYVDDRITGADPLLELTSWNLNDIEQNTVSTVHLQPMERGFADWGVTGDVRASSAAYVAVESAGRPATAIKIRNSTGATLSPYMQIWVVRLQ